MGLEGKRHKYILFVCSGNTCRSPMAAAIFNHFAERSQVGWLAVSAGMATESGLPVTPIAKEVLAEAGINLEDHRSRQLEERMIKEAEIVLTMTATQRDLLQIYYPKTAEKIYTVYEFIGSTDDVMDPFGGDKQIYRETAESLIFVMPKIVEKLKEIDESS